MSSYKVYNPYDNETGELGKPAPKKVVPVKPTFRTNVLKLGQSSNVIDNREILFGMHSVVVYGYLTWNTWYHLRTSVKPSITSALQRRGFNVFGVNVGYRDVANSQYSFEIFLRVLNQYKTQDVVNSITTALAQSVALPGSIRITMVRELRSPKQYG
jgi:hypothetical protein